MKCSKEFSKEGTRRKRQTAQVSGGLFSFHRAEKKRDQVTQDHGEAVEEKARGPGKHVRAKGAGGKGVTWSREEGAGCNSARPAAAQVSVHRDRLGQKQWTRF